VFLKALTRGPSRTWKKRKIVILMQRARGWVYVHEQYPQGSCHDRGPRVVSNEGNVAGLEEKKERVGRREGRGVPENDRRTYTKESASVKDGKKQ